MTESNAQSGSPALTAAMSRNVELLSYYDLGTGNAGYQMAMQEVDGRFYLYCAHWAKQGISVFEVSDPRAPRFVRFLPEPSGKTGISSVKLQVADGIGILNMQTRKFDMFFGPQPEGTEFDEGLVIWDFSDPEAPTPIGRWSSGSQFGTHRNYYDGGRYVHLTSGAPGYKGFIYRILDIADVSNPVVVGQWAHPEQWTLDNPRCRARRAAHALHRRRPGLPGLLGRRHGHPRHLRRHPAAAPVDPAHPPALRRRVRRRVGPHDRPVRRTASSRSSRPRANARSSSTPTAPRGSPAYATSSTR